jgi:hypothetical protein
MNLSIIGSHILSRASLLMVRELPKEYLILIRAISGITIIMKQMQAKVRNSTITEVKR